MSFLNCVGNHAENGKEKTEQEIEDRYLLSTVPVEWPVWGEGIERI